MSLYVKSIVTVVFLLLVTTEIIPKEVAKDILVILGLFYIINVLKEIIIGFRHEN